MNRQEGVYFFPCPKCRGLGKVVVTHSGTHNISFSVKQIACPKCKGTGRMEIKEQTNDNTSTH